MADVKWTKRQQQAINASGGGLLVSAAAGSGKTAVLVERIVQKITNPHHPAELDKFLVVTFSNAAARGVKDKIIEALYKKIAEAPGNLHLQRQLAKIGSASIDTVHGFCLKLIKNNIERLDLPSRFRIAEENEIAILENEVLGDVLEKWYEEKENTIEFQAMLDQFSDVKGDDKLSTLLLELRKAFPAQPDVGQCRDKLQGLKGQPPLLTAHGRYVLRYCNECAEYLHTLSSELIRHAEEDAALQSVLAVLLQEKELVQQLLSVLNTKEYNTIRELVLNVSYQTMRFPGKYQNEELKNAIQGKRKEFKKVWEEIESFFLLAEEQIEKDIEAIESPVSLLLSILSDFEEAFGRKKLSLGIIDFNDIEHFAIALLIKRYDPATGEFEKTDLADELARTFDEVFVDEYQDTNLLQDLIFRAVSKDEKNLFMVGDIKQSIYRFRQARPEIFNGKKNAYAAYDETGKQDFFKIELNSNFRSRKAVLQSVNYLFERLMDERVGEVEYSGEELLHFGSAAFDEKEDCPVEVDIILSDCAVQESEEEEEGAEEKGQTAAGAEAQHIANRIKAIVGKELVRDKDSGNMRPAGYRDIVILMRSFTSRIERLERILEQNGIPVYCDTTSVFFEREEISTILSLLQVIDNPRQDVHLVAAMRSLVYSFTSDELLEIRLLHPGVPFYEAVRAQAAEGDVKCASFLENLESFRLLSRSLSTDKLVYHIYEETGLLITVGLLRDGGLRQANLMLLYEYARQYEETEFHGLFSFNSYIDRIKNNDRQIPAAKAFSENSDVVRIMTYHRSKGLEFPVVILPDLSKRFNQESGRKRLIADPELGICCRIKDIGKFSDYETFFRKAAALKVKTEGLSEEMRVLYVAITRPMERLILISSVKRSQTGTIDQIKPCALDERGKTSRYEVLKAGSFTRWIFDALQHHKSAAEVCTALGMESGREEGGNFCCTLFHATDITTEAQKQETEEYKKRFVVTEKLRKEIAKRADYVYPYITDSPAKLSVTKIKRMVTVNKDGVESAAADAGKPGGSFLFKRPSFVKDATQLTAAEKGTALHMVMQHLPFDLAPEQIESFLLELVEREFISEKQRGAVKTETIRSFLNSDLARRMRESEKLLREKKFNIALPISQIVHLTGIEMDADGAEAILLQGVIDCVFFENGKPVLVDFKTDRVEDMSELIDRYNVQMKLYAHAVKELFGEFPWESIIYSLHLSKEIDCQPEMVQ